MGGWPGWVDRNGWLNNKMVWMWTWMESVKQSIHVQQPHGLGLGGKKSCSCQGQDFSLRAKAKNWGAKAKTLSSKAWGVLEDLRDQGQTSRTTRLLFICDCYRWLCVIAAWIIRLSMCRGMMLSPIALGPRNDFQLRPSGKWHVDLEKSKGLLIIIAFCFSDPLFFSCSLMQFY